MDFLILSLATFRLASLLSDEKGPYAIFSRFRYWAGERRNESGRTGTNEFARGLICFWCVSIWIGMILGVAWYMFKDTSTIVWLMTPFALSSVAIIVNKGTE